MSDGFTEKDIQLAGFFVRARPLVKRVGIIAAILIDVVFIVVGVWYWGQWFGQSRIDHFQGLRSFYAEATPAATAHRNVLAARPLEVREVRVLEGALDTTDYIAIVENPNDRWLARVTYSFVGTAETETRVGMVLPGERRVLGVFGSDVDMGSARLIMQRVEWDRIDAHQVADIEAFTSERKQIRVDRTEYLTADAQVTTDRVRFVIANDSPYSFFSVSAVALVYVNESIAGVEHIEISPFRSFSEQEVELHTKSRGVRPTRVEVLTHVDVFDEKAYIRVGG